MKKVKHFCCLVSIILILLCSVSFGACSHPVSKRITKREATCTETGLAQIRCASCNALIKPVTIPKKHIHIKLQHVRNRRLVPAVELLLVKNLDITGM